MSSSEDIDHEKDLDWRLQFFVYFIAIFYTVAGLYVCKECWPLVKDIWRSYYPDKTKQKLSEKKTN